MRWENCTLLGDPFFYRDLEQYWDPEDGRPMSQSAMILIGTTDCLRKVLLRSRVIGIEIRDGRERRFGLARADPKKHRSGRIAVGHLLFL